MIEGLISAIVLIIFVETISLILPEGKAYGLVKWALSLIVTLSVLTPIFSFFSSNLSKVETYQTKSEFFYEITELAVDYDKKALSEKLTDLGVLDYEIGVEYDECEEIVEYKSVKIVIKKIKNVNLEKQTIVDEVKLVFGEVAVDIYDEY